MTTQKKMTVRVKTPIALLATKLGETDVSKAISASVKGPWLVIDLPSESGADGSSVVEKIPQLVIPIQDVLDQFPEIGKALGSLPITSIYTLATDLVFESGAEQDFK